MKRVLIVADGYNIYCGVQHSTKRKWLDICGLVQRHLRRDEAIVRMLYFTTMHPSNKSKKITHAKYIKELKRTGFEAHTGRFSSKIKTINSQKIKTEDLSEIEKDLLQKLQNTELKLEMNEEKEVDVRMAIEIVLAAERAEFDTLYLISGDGDMVPVIQKIKEINPQITCTVMRPLKAKLSYRLKAVADKIVLLNKRDYANNQLPNSPYPKKSNSKKASV